MTLCAEEICHATSQDCAAVGQWNVSVALGAGVITNPLINGKNIPLVVVPQVSYYGKRIFLDDLDLGFTLADTTHNTFNLIASPGYDRAFFYRSDLQNIFVLATPEGTIVVPASTPGAVALPRRSRPVTYLAGPEWSFDYGGVTGQLDLLHEITGHNEGDEIRAAVAVPLSVTRGTLSAHFGFTWKSAAVVRYFYGEPGIYEPRAALNPFLKLSYVLPMSRHWRFKTYAQYEQLGGAIINSPIVAERFFFAAFAGAVYAF
jgi:outer membrane protein